MALETRSAVDRALFHNRPSLVGRQTSLLYAKNRRGSGSSSVGGINPLYEDFKDPDRTVDYWWTQHPNYVGPAKTKIVCTIGPASSSTDKLEELLVAGMNVIRLNFSHADREFCEKVVANARVVTKRTHRLCGIMLDTTGPEIRTGLVKGKSVRLEEGSTFVLTTDMNVVGDCNRVAVSYPELPQIVQEGQVLFLDTGLMSCVVVSKTDTEIVCKMNDSGELRDRKGVVVPGAVLNLPALSKNDLEGISFGIEQGVDFVAASFVRSAKDVRDVRSALGSGGEHIQIIAKIENQQGINNFDEILLEADGIMVARGNLGVDAPIEQVTLHQKVMIRKCNEAGKPVITATQMLESMIVNPSPTRAEATDVANAVFDGSDAVMLSGETAIGSYAAESVRTMSEICREAERSVDYKTLSRSIHHRVTHEKVISIGESLASAAVKTLFDLRGALLISVTVTGRTARWVAKFRPSAPILCFTETEHTARQCLLLRGVLPLLVGSLSGLDSLVARAITVAKDLNICSVGDTVVLAAGVMPGDVEGTGNVLKVARVRY